MGGVLREGLRYYLLGVADEEFGEVEDEFGIGATRCVTAI